MTSGLPIRPPRLLWFAVVLAAFLFTASGRAQSQVPSLLAAAPGVRVPQTLAARVDTLQIRPVSVNHAALAGPMLDIELTSGRVVRAELDRRETHRDGSEAWAGHVAGEPMSSVTLVTRNGILQGAVRTLDGAYSIEPAAGGPGHVVRLVDADATGQDLEPLAPPPAALADPADDVPPMAGDDGSTFDVLVLYTAAARTAAGSDLAVQTRIALGVSETNTAYANSGIAPRLRLVGAEFTSYTEAGSLQVDLERFQNTSDGFIDEAHTRRNALGADLVVLVVGATAGGACGVGYVMTSLSSGFAAWAFSVTAYSCISPNYTFAHELGHNMGSAHAPEDGVNQSSLYAYSFGYKHPSNTFRTVMAYNCPVNCPRVLHFSNPNVNYSGSATGTVSQHHNALSIANAASTIANWRQAVSSGTPPTISAIADRTISEDTATPAIAFTVNDAETAPGSLVVTASSSNTTLVPNTLGALSLGGSGGSRTLTVTPTANRSGVSTISVTVSDGAQTATETFLLTVTAVNDAPTIARSPGAATIASGLSTQTTVTVSDIDTAGSALSLTAVSSNTTVLPDAAIGVAISGTSSTSRTFVVTMTPALGQAGQSTVTLTGSDGAASAPTTFVLTVTIPVPPTISPVPAQTTPEDVPLVVPFTVADTDTPLGDLTIQAVSSNSGVVPPSGLLVGGTGNARTLTITPAANQNGTSTITLSVSDGLATVHTGFVLTVSAVDDPPLFAAGVPLNISTVSSVPTSFPVTVTDVDTPGSSLLLNGASSNHAVLSPGGLAIVPVSSTATSRTFDVSVTPVSGATGTATITLQAADGTSTLSRGVQLTVTAAPSAPDAPTALSASLSGTTLTLTWTPATTGSTPDSFEVRIGNAPGATTLPVRTTSASTLEVPLTASGTYYARVHAVNAYGTGLPSPEVSITTGPLNLRPGAPQGLNASFSGRTLTLSWLAPTTGNPATSYTLEAGSAPGVADIVVVPVGSATTFTAPGVPDGVFWVRIRGVNAAGVGAPSSDVALVMSSGAGCVGLPLAPVLRPAVVTGSTVALGWDPPGGTVTPTGYVLLAGTSPGLANIGAIDLGSTATAFGAVAPPGTYFLRVAARSACGAGAPSNEITMSVAGAGVLPAAPTGLTSAVAGRTVSLSWTAPGSGAPPTSYSVEVGSWSGGVNLAVLDTGGTATAISGPVAPGTYYIRVRTRAGALLSSASNEVIVVVP